jgi:DNA-binding transcriptional MerR regulator
MTTPTATPTRATPPPTFSAVEVAQLAGVTYRQLDYWARNGQLVPSVAQAEGQGSHRRYSSFDVAEARVLGRLSALGINANRARAVLPDTLPDLLDHLIVELHALAANYPERSAHDHHPAP